MVIDSHAHIVMPPESFRFMAELVGGRANPNTLPKIPDASVRKVAEELVKSMDNVGTDVQFISPRPYLQMHSVKPGRVTELWTIHCNDLIARLVQMFPDRFRAWPACRSTWTRRWSCAPSRSCAAVSTNSVSSAA
jgi:4-oxalmesaconate hydratase